MKYMIKSERGYVNNILITSAAKGSQMTFVTYTDDSKNALCFYSEKDAQKQAKRFKCVVVS